MLILVNMLFLWQYILVKKEVLGVIGPIRAGKDTASDYLSDKLDIPHFQISSPLELISQERGVEPTRENLIALGTEVAKQHGDGYLAQYLLDCAPTVSIMTGMRQLGQLAVLRSSARLTLISIDAYPAVRFGRSLSDPKPGEATTVEEFIAREIAENSPPNAQRLFECMGQADHPLLNNGTKDELYAALDVVLQEL